MRSVRLQGNTEVSPESGDARTSPDYLFLTTGSCEPVILDYDRLVTNVEDQIMTDQDSGGSQYDPVYLLYKSNPGLFENDFTNPRNVYSLISKRRVKSYDDVSNVSKSADSVPSDYPRITRTTSMRDLRRAAGLRTASRKERHYSSQDLRSLTLKERKDPSITALFINAPYLNLKDLEHLPEVEAQRVARTILPTISSKKRVKNKAPPFKLTDEDKGFPLPVIKSVSGETLPYLNRGEDRGDVIKKRIIRLESNLEENNLEKWFSEMPDDVKEQADKMATGEETNNQSESDSSQQKLPRKSSKEKIHLPILRPLNPIPNQYLELRENVKRPIKRDVIIDREHYKLKQRSMLRLKMLGDENARTERHRTHSDAEIPLYQYDADKFHHQEQKTTLKDLMNAKRQDGDGLKTVNIDQFAVEAYDIHPSEKFNFAKQTVENNGSRSGLFRARTSVDVTPIRLRNTLHSSESKVSPGHNERSWQKAKSVEQPLDRALSVIKIEKKSTDESRSETADPDNRQVTSPGSHSSVTNQNGRNAPPPTRDSNQDASKSEAKREILKFKRLEVFGDTSAKKLSPIKNTDKPLVKLDLRCSPTEWQKAPGVCPQPPLPLIQRDLKKELPAMTFQFSTGEVIISRNAANALSPPRDHQRHSFYPKRGPIKSNNTAEPVASRSDSSNTEMTNKHQDTPEVDDASTDYTMTPDYRNISEFNLSGRGRPRGRLWDFDGDNPQQESLLGSRKNTIEEIPEETMDQLSPDPPVQETPKQPEQTTSVDAPPAELPPEHSPNTTPSDQIPSPSKLMEPSAGKIDVVTAPENKLNEKPSEGNQSTEKPSEENQSTEKPLEDSTVDNFQQTQEQEVEAVPASTNKSNDEKQTEENQNTEEVADKTAKEEAFSKAEVTKRDAATSATSLIEANAKRLNATSKNTDHSTDSIAEFEVFGT